ncbi:MAG: sulfurtransferase TusA family protein [Planctomycetota bacterium]
MNRDSPRAEDVIAHVDRCRGTPCASCAIVLLGHDAVVGLLLGFADEPACIACLARRHGREPAVFLESAYRSIRQLACYRAGWRHADERLSSEGPWPGERIPARLRMPADEGAEPADERVATGTETSPEEDLEAAVAASKRLVHWDAGDRGCGELALELKLRVRRLDSGGRLLLRTTDPGAPADLPAWCRLTGNLLVAAAPPRYLVESCARPSSHPDP